MMGVVISLISGCLFGVGLLVSGMTQPQKVTGFLDFTGNWDPSLALVMVGAISVYALLSRIIQKRTEPLHAASFSLPTSRDFDAPLIGGAVIFGVGWGLSGFCPAPGIVAAGSGESTALVFLVAMLAGMFAHRLLHQSPSLARAVPIPVEPEG